MDSRLLFVDKNGTTEGKLHKISPREKLFNEKWLQELLISNPNLLPIKDIDPSWDNLIPLGSEVSVTCGSIDNLYITVDGMICLVETKLWRNPEAHRTVVAQIIDYAKDLSGISFEEFVKTVQQSQIRGERPDFWTRISRHVKDVNQIEFQSKTQDVLDHGRFLLLIVGDKIYPEVAMLTETIQSAPNLEFTIGMVELQMFKTSKEKPWPLLIMPRVIGKTHEVIRSVVRILYEEKKPDIEVTTTSEKEKGLRTKTDKKTFASSMPKDFADIFVPVLEHWIADGFNISWGSVGLGVRFFWKRKLRTIVTIYPNCIGLLREDQVKKKEIPSDPYRGYREAIDKIPVARRLLSEGRYYVYFRDVSSLEQFKALVDETDKLVRDYKKLEEKA